MTYSDASAARAAHSVCLARLGGFFLLLMGLLPGTARAQAPAWAGASPGSLSQASGTSQTRGVATDASGNVFVTGYFTGSVAFGSTLLTSRGGNDLFVAKYVPGTDTWAWAQSGGGTGADLGLGIAVSSSGVYVTGQLQNSTANASGVLFGGTGTTPGTVPQYGASGTNTADLLLAKYTDNGTSATLGWTQVGGGTGTDIGYGVAVSGGSVYVTGSIQNTTGNVTGVLFGGTGTTPGTVQVNGTTGSGTSDLVLTKYTDNGSSATLGWTQVGGGTGQDQGLGVAVSGTSVYVTGYLTNNTGNTNGVLFGGTGTTPGTVPQYGAASGTASNDLVLAKYTDNGTSATLGWTQVGGGTNPDLGYGVAVSGGSVYVTGQLANTTGNANGVLFGGTGTTPGTVQVNGATSINSTDLVLAKYTDNGSSATLGWTQVGGGPSGDVGYGVAVSGQKVLAAGFVTPAASFGSYTIASPAGASTSVLARLVDASLTPLPVQLVQFTATAAGAAVRLTWATASEVHSARFEVERSRDGRAFERIGTVAAAGSSTTPRSYELTDAKLPDGATLYYRLKQVDLDGTFSYSPVRTVALTGAAAGLALYPNPAHGGAATLTGARPGAVVTVHDALGRPVVSATADAAGTAALALPAGLPAGVYVVRAGTRAVRLTVE